MESNYKPILPASASELVSPPKDDSPPNKRTKDQARSARRAIVRAACKACRRRKTRCDGKRPVCVSCQNRELDCEWDVEPGLSRISALKSKKDKLERDVSSMLELYWYLHAKSAEDVSSIVERIRSGADIASVLEFVSAAKNGSPAGEPLQQTLCAGSRSSGSSKSPKLEPNQATSPEIAPFQCAEGSNILAALSLSNALPTMKTGIDNFFTCTGALFPTFTREEADNMEREIIAPIQAHGYNWLLDSTDEPVSMRRKAALSELCGMAAIGLQYNSSTLPGLGMPTAREPGLFEFDKAFYAISKRYLDTAIESNPFRAMKLCALLSMFNVITHSSVALAYVGMGISLGINNGLSHELRPSGMSQAEFLTYKKTLRTLITLQSWLVATLGYLNNSIEPSFKSQCISVECIEIESIIQQEMAKVTVIQARILMTARNSKELSNSSLRSMREDLMHWHEQLPKWMRLQNLVERPEISEEERRITLYAHLFYLSAVLLVSRAVHASQLDIDNAYNSDELRLAVHEGILAARSSAQILSLLLAEGSLFKKCWLCIFQSYVSCISLLYAVTKRMLSGGQIDLWEQDIALAKHCLRILAFCASSDYIARNFERRILGVFQDLDIAQKEVRNSPRKLGNMSENDTSNEYGYLFNTSSSISLQILAKELTQLLSHPFMGMPKPSIQQTLTSCDEITLGTHLNWSHHLFSSYSGDAGLQVNDHSGQIAASPSVLLNLRPGHFPDTTEPYGWTLTSQTLA